MCVQAIAGEWKLPLVKFDTAAIFDKYIGETEKRIQKVFQVAEELSPCVLWIDELEKVFAGSGPDSASADAGVSSRLLAAFLSWMQERKAPVFVAAACDNVSALPPETDSQRQVRGIVLCRPAKPGGAKADLRA
jgi:SpoVK/Ycf46/Vps4 family AAA+-type ATPase